MADKYDDTEAAEIIVAELATYEGMKGSTADGIVVLCPFHDERTPSCSINLAHDKKVPLGFFHCFGCGAKGGWNKFAAATNLEQIKGWKLDFKGSTSSRWLKDMQERLITDSSEEKAYKKAGSREGIPWNPNKDWRGIKGKLLAAIGAKYLSLRGRDDMVALLSVTIRGRLKGTIKATIHKEHKKQLSYVNSDGDWAKKYGLFPFDYVRKITKKKRINYVVLVEGPRDALRLIQYGIPALAVLGSKNITKKKIMLAMAASQGIEYLVILPDSDRAGDEMADKIEFCARGICKTVRINLPTEYDEDDTELEVDPGNVSEEFLIKLRKYLRKTFIHETRVGA